MACDAPETFVKHSHFIRWSTIHTVGHKTAGFVPAFLGLQTQMFNSINRSRIWINCCGIISNACDVYFLVYCYSVTVTTVSWTLFTVLWLPWHTDLTPYLVLNRYSALSYSVILSLLVVKHFMLSDHTATITMVCWTVSSSVAINHNVFNVSLFSDHTETITMVRWTVSSSVAIKHYVSQCS